jgi:hypothetical protein
MLFRYSENKNAASYLARHAIGIHSIAPASVASESLHSL